MYVINFFGGPGVGKSAFATGVLSKLKFKEVNCEYVGEFAKDLTWEDRYVALGNQWHVTSTQLHRIHRLIDKVDFVITDSPIIIGCLYYKDDNPHFEVGVLHEFNKYSNINYFINRTRPYRREGRLHSLEEAKEIDISMKNFLTLNNIKFKEIEDKEEYISAISNECMMIRKNQ